MKSIPIYIWDTAPREKVQALIDENEALGFEKNKNIPKVEDKMMLVDFNFDDKKFIGYWIDNDIHDDSHTRDIIFYIGGTSFRTPLLTSTINLFNQILLREK
jgi:hypothetical protein